MEVVKDRGYQTQKSVEMAIAKDLQMKKSAVKSKMLKGTFTKEECECIGSLFEMTMKEYYQVFMDGLFVEDDEGHYKCHIDNHFLHTHPQPSTKSPQATKRDSIERSLERIRELEYNEDS